MPISDFVGCNSLDDIAIGIETEKKSTLVLILVRAKIDAIHTVSFVCPPNKRKTVDYLASKSVGIVNLRSAFVV